MQAMFARQGCRIHVNISGVSKCLNRKFAGYPRALLPRYLNFTSLLSTSLHDFHRQQPVVTLPSKSYLTPLQTSESSNGNLTVLEPTETSIELGASPSLVDLQTSGVTIMAVCPLTELALSFGLRVLSQ